MTGTGLVDALLPVDDFDFRGAERWHVLVLCGRLPAVRVDLASPGAVSGGALATAALARHADYECARQKLIEHLCGRIAQDERQDSSPLVSVVVCTHRRPGQLRTLLDSLGRLDPAPFEVLVVDNDPGPDDCREVVEAAGFRYLREDRRGLDNARNSGVRAARGEVVSFIDDDCVASPHWLAPIARGFAHDGVAALTGPAFPYRLDTPTREMMERKASLARGLRRVAFDWQSMSPLHAAAMGVGANMSFRKALLPNRSEPFPPELDAGTETESGGDSYLLGRILDAGFRVVYDPEMFVFHQHRDEPGALRKAVSGYGIGLSAALTKLVVEERELTAPRAWVWLVKQYVWTQRRRAAGKADAIETRLSWEYLRGGFLGTARWIEALRTQREAGRKAIAVQDGAGAQPALGGNPALPLAPEAEAVLAAAVDGDGPALSVVIPTYRREDALERCLRAFAAQDLPGSFEVLVVDDDSEGAGIDEAPAAWPFPLRRIANGGEGAAAARNHGAREAAAPLLLFIDDDVVADPSLVREHLRWHSERGEGAVLVGPYRPRPKENNLAAQVARLWWQDLFDLLKEAQGTTFIAALTANVSLHRSTFDRIGGLAEEYSKERREDWEWGLRMLRAGVPIGFHAAASARHEFTLGTEQRLRDARREGIGDTLIAATYPEAVPSLPLRHVRAPGPGRPVRWLAKLAWEREAMRRGTIRLLELLEWGRFRGTWLRIFEVAQGLSYDQGAFSGGWKGARGAELEALDVDLLGSEPIEPPEVIAPLLRARVKGAEVGRVRPPEGLWTASLAEEAVNAMDHDDVIGAAIQAGWLERPEAHEHAAKTEVLFGPASTYADLAHREELEAAGALVRVAPGDASGHWRALAAAAHEGSRPLVAIPLPGSSPRAAWLQDALAAFDGERVGIVFGAAEAWDLPRPLYLHDSRFVHRWLTLSGRRPAYVVMRRELALRLGDAGEAAEPLIAAVGDAFDSGWIVGHRECRGLREPHYRPKDLGRAYGRAETARISAIADSGRRRRTLLREALRGLLVLGWQLTKGRGRLEPNERAVAAGLIGASLRGLPRAVSGARQGRRKA